MAASDAGSSKGKQADSNGGFRPHNNMAMVVQPPKPEDLQRSYATVVSADANPKGWYGSMSM
jgi:hypothetical protein